MPEWTQLDIDYRPFGVGSDTFVLSKEGFSAGDIGKSDSAPDSPRQAHFEAELERIAEAVGGFELPVFVRFRGGERRRMDKGCVGHAVARGFLEPPVDAVSGIVASVTLRPAVGGLGNG